MDEVKKRVLGRGLGLEFCAREIKDHEIIDLNSNTSYLMNIVKSKKAALKFRKGSIGIGA